MLRWIVEHNISRTEETPRHRPDMSTFFTALSQISISPSSSHNNPHATPTPVSYANTARLLQSQYEYLLTNLPGDSGTDSPNPLLTTLLDLLADSIDNPPQSVEAEGLPQSFVDALDRVDKKSLKPDDQCPICSERYLDDKYPLVVRLPCDDRHWFCLECVGPWLRFKGTCPLDRKVLGRRDKLDKTATAAKGAEVGNDEDDNEDEMGLYG